VDNLHVDSKLAALVTDDKDTNRATTRLEGFAEARPQVRLIDDGDGLLDITGLSHGNDSAILKIEHSVLLEDWAEHGLDDDGWAWVGDEGRVLVQLLGEEVDTQVSVLAGSTRGGDADDLARATLEDYEVANTDVVAWDGDGVGDMGLLLAVGGGGRSIFIVVTHGVVGRELGLLVLSWLDLLLRDDDLFTTNR